jgi:STE24 endopeptidase
MSDDVRARRYARLQLVLGLVALAVILAFLLATLVTGAAHALAAWAARLTDAPALALGLVVIVLGLAQALLTFPLAWVRGFYLPRRFGLLHQPLGAWLRDRAKAAAIGGMLALAGVETIYALLRVTEWWWLFAALVFLAAYAVIATVFPAGSACPPSTSSSSINHARAAPPMPRSRGSAAPGASSCSTRS